MRNGSISPLSVLTATAKRPSWRPTQLHTLYHGTQPFTIFSKYCLEITSWYLTNDWFWRQALTTVENCTPFLKRFPGITLLDLVTSLTARARLKTNQLTFLQSYYNKKSEIQYIHTSLTNLIQHQNPEIWQNPLASNICYEHNHFKPVQPCI